MTEKSTSQRIEKLRIAKLQAEALFDAAACRLERARRQYETAQDAYRNAVDAYLASIEQMEDES